MVVDEVAAVLGPAPLLPVPLPQKQLELPGVLPPLPLYRRRDPLRVDVLRRQQGTSPFARLAHYVTMCNSLVYQSGRQFFLPLQADSCNPYSNLRACVLTLRQDKNQKT